MKKNKWNRAHATFAFACVALMAVPSSAGLTTYTDPVTWGNAHGGTATLEDFESADIGGDADDNGNLEDISAGPAATPVSFNDIKLGTNADFFNNGLIDVGDGSAPDGSGNGFFGFRAGINGNVVVDMAFVNFTGGNSAPGAPEFVEITLPSGTTAVSFIYRNGDFSGDGMTLSIDGVEIDGNLVNHSGPDFDGQDPRYFAPQDSGKIPGGGTGTGPSFFGITNDMGFISTLRFSASGPGGTSFASLDDLQFVVPEPTSIVLLGVAGIAVLGMRRKSFSIG